MTSDGLTLRRLALIVYALFVTVMVIGIILALYRYRGWLLAVAVGAVLLGVSYTLDAVRAGAPWR